MAALTGTQIVALARIYAQDVAGTGISDAQALDTLNDVLLALRDEHETANEAIVPASTSGLSFSAGETVKTTSISTLQDIVSAHPSNTNAANTILTPALERRTVGEILELLADEGDGTVSQGGSEWLYWAAERTDGGQPGTWRVLVYPALSVTRHLTIRGFTYQTIAALANTPDLDERLARDVARICALIWCPLLGRSESFVGGLLRWIKPELLERVGGATAYARSMPTRIAEREG